jgi:SAM-dependent methyltransferase
MSAPPPPPIPHAPVEQASPWIARFAPLVAPGGCVLDLACGYGRHARLFVARGHPVLAVDRDPAALASMAGIERIETRELDLEAGVWPLAGERFAAIVVTQYLHRPLFPDIAAALEDDGVLLYETFARGNEAYGRPANPDFLLEPAELLRAFGERLTVVAFEQGLSTLAGRAAVIERVAAVGPGRAWPPALPTG